MMTPDCFRRLCLSREVLAATSLPVRDVARSAGISTFHFIRLFESLFGVTPHQFRIRARISRAKELLALGEHSVTDVCMDVGFESLGSFSRLFTRRVGLAPSVYQRTARVMVTVPRELPVRLFPGCLSLMGQLPPAAFRNFEEASAKPGSVNSGHANQTHQHHGGRSGQGPAVLHGGARL